MDRWALTRRALAAIAVALVTVASLGVLGVMAPRISDQIVADD